jgi:hypothetical protein
VVVIGEVRIAEIWCESMRFRIAKTLFFGVDEDRCEGFELGGKTNTQVNETHVAGRVERCEAVYWLVGWPKPGHRSEAVNVPRRRELHEVMALVDQFVGREWTEVIVRRGVEVFGDYLLRVGTMCWEDARHYASDFKTAGGIADADGELDGGAGESMPVVLKQDVVGVERLRSNVKALAAGAISSETMPATWGECAKAVGFFRRLIPGEVSGGFCCEVNLLRVATGWVDGPGLAVSGATDEGDRGDLGQGRSSDEQQGREQAA